jgi:ABC-type iron transport system FetAB ATPase subunit
LSSVYLRLFDYDRFHSQVIQERKGGKPKDWVLALCSKAAELLRLLSTRKGGDEHGNTMHSDNGDIECTSFNDNDESDTTPGTFRQSNGTRETSNCHCLLRLSKGKISQGSQPLLSDLNLSLRQGEIVMVTGPSGCGKSSFLRALALLEPLVRGVLEFRGEEPVSRTAWRNEVLYVRQSGGRGLPGTPSELLSSILKFHTQCHRRHFKNDMDHHRDQARNYLLEYLETVGLPADTIDFQWERLSGGESQRVYLCVMLALRPSLLLLDEPTQLQRWKNSLLLVASLHYGYLMILLKWNGCSVITIKRRVSSIIRHQNLKTYYRS